VSNDSVTPTYAYAQVSSPSLDDFNQDNTSNSPNNHAYVTIVTQIASSYHSSNTTNHNSSPNVSPPSASSSSSFPASASFDASPSPILPLRKSTRNVQPPKYLQDYHCTSH